ncbi:hypothetical protein LTR17_019004 [Elasticomyces elasticus]|nr:hypothetical protein LTR17_019004 [Elasticomyces elasticus]
MASLSRLLALPRELRDIIYAFSVISGEQTLRIKQQPPAPGQSQFTSYSPLLLVCKQVSAEYVESFAKNILSPGHEEVHVAVTVPDLDFAGLQAIIRSLRSGQVDHLRAECRLQVCLVFSYNVPGNELVTDTRMKSWARFCKSEGLHATYEVDETASRWWDWYGGDVFDPWMCDPDLPEDDALTNAICCWTAKYENRLIREIIAAKSAAQLKESATTSQENDDGESAGHSTGV